MFFFVYTWRHTTVKWFVGAGCKVEASFNNLGTLQLYIATVRFVNKILLWSARSVIWPTRMTINSAFNAKTNCPSAIFQHLNFKFESDKQWRRSWWKVDCSLDIQPSCVQVHPESVYSRNYELPCHELVLLAWLAPAGSTNVLFLFSYHTAYFKWCSELVSAINKHYLLGEICLVVLWLGKPRRGVC